MSIAIGYGQFEPKFGKVAENLRQVEDFVKEASGADLLVFPELGLTGYEFVDAEEVREFAEPFGAGPTSAALLDLASTHGVSIVIGYPERTSEGCYNACILAQPNGALASYRKIHLFSRETFLFRPGDAAPPVVQTPAGRVGLMICFDWLFPETARLLALGGAQIIAHPSNLVLDYCQRAMYCRSVENCVFTITANRTGTEERAGRSLTFTGASQVLDPHGQTLVQAPAAEPHLGVVEVDPSEADDKGVTEYNHRFDDRRVELYGGLLGDPKGDGCSGASIQAPPALRPESRRR